MLGIKRKFLKKKQKSRFETVYRILIHLTIWILYFFYENGAVLLIYPGRVFLFTSSLYFILNAIIFYLNYFLIVRIKRDRFRHIKRIVVLLALAFLYLILNHSLTVYIHYRGLENPMYTDSLKEFMILRLFRFAYLISISYTYWLIEYKFKADKKLIETEIKGIEDLKKTTRLEKEKLRAELNYLRLQINPHFLFNTLSFIYTEVISHSEKASKSIMLLSNIMRNAFIATDQEGKIPLSHEVKHLENLIEIHQLRFDRQLNINLYLPEPDSLNNINISPFILITFVENLFKHGDLKNERNAAEIRLTVENQQVRFYIRNRKKIRNPNIDFHNNIISDKIGVINVKKRLKLTYPNLHTLDIIDDGKFYTVCLTLNIEDANLHNNR